MKFSFDNCNFFNVLYAHNRLTSFRFKNCKQPNPFIGCLKPGALHPVSTVAVETETFSAEEHDEKYDDAVALVTKTRQASISMIQRHLRIGYNRAARIIETMEKEGVVGPADGVKPREVLVRSYDDIS